MSTTNFNYQVALKEGLKNLQQGRLRQAEQSFKYLVKAFPGAEGGYRGLAKVHFEQEDRASALRVLRDGASALTKSGERSAAIGLLREAVSLDPRDLATHRRLGAALALAGDGDAAVQEYARFIRDLRDAGDMERARSEAAYGMGQLRELPGASSLAGLVTAEAGSSEPSAADDRTREDAMRAAFGGAARAPEREDDPWTSSRPERTVSPTPAPTPPPSIERADDPWAAAPPRSAAEPMPMSAPPTTGPADEDRWMAPPAPPSGTNAHTWREASVEVSETFTAVPEEPAPAGIGDGEPLAEADSAHIEAAAARYLATRDPRAAPLALEAARRYILEGHTDAASDLLLQLIAAGVADHDAQRLLVDVARTLGKHEVAKAKCQLLAQALLLDGRNDLAAEVEALAQAD